MIEDNSGSDAGALTLHLSYMRGHAVCLDYTTLKSTPHGDSVSLALSGTIDPCIHPSQSVNSRNTVGRAARVA